MNKATLKMRRNLRDTSFRKYASQAEVDKFLNARLSDALFLIDRCCNHVNQSPITFSIISQIHQNLIPRKKSFSPSKPKNNLTYQNLTLPRGVWVGKRPYKALKDLNLPKPIAAN